MKNKHNSIQKENDDSIKPELFFGLVGAVGSDINRAQRILIARLKAANYKTTVIKMSQLIEEYAQAKGITSEYKGKGEDNRIRRLMQLGDKIREETKSGETIAALSILFIQKYREEISEDGKPIHNHAFVFNSLKHPDEINVFRKVYGDSFFAISIYSPENKRIESLISLISKSNKSLKDESYKENAKYIIEWDQKRPGKYIGQNVKDTFPLSDVFIQDNEKMDSQLGRFVDIIFGYPFSTPTIDEHGMFHAKAAALRSADLSRQVGALIATRSGEFLAAGCNEVPKSGGGSHWEGQPEAEDDRDFTHKRDFNAVMRYDIFEEVFDNLNKAGFISDTHKSKTPREMADHIIDQTKILKETRVSNLIEFGRIVHAEMSAITEAARRGIPIKDSTLYCTTFPCHMCARHIISSGVKRVVYIEPYPKSMTKDLYKTSTNIEENNNDENAVRFDPFVGVSPYIYMRLFSMPQRKDAFGYAINWDISSSMPRFYKSMGGNSAQERALISALLEQYPPQNGATSGDENEQPVMDRGTDQKK